MKQLVEKAPRLGDIRPELKAAALARDNVASFTGVQMVSDVHTDRDDVLERIEGGRSRSPAQG